MWRRTSVLRSLFFRADRILRRGFAGEGHDRVLRRHFDDRAVAGLLLVGAERRAGGRIDERLADVEYRELVADLHAALGAEVDPRAVALDLDDQAFRTAGRVRRRSETREVIAGRELLDDGLRRLLNR